MSLVLLIEPDKIIASNLSKVLIKAGHSVDWQVDPQIALDIADTKLPEVIIVDLILAGHGGVEFLYEFRSYPDWQEIPIVVFSTLSAEELKHTLSGFEHLDISSYHYKPTTTLGELAQAVDRIAQPATG